MDSEQYNFSAEESQENSLKDILLKYLYNWKWFVLSIVVSLVLGFVYLRYQTPLYEVNATILIKDDKKGGSISDELSAFEDLGILKNNRNIDNEIEILRSRSLMARVVNELKLNISYYAYGRPIEHERFFDTPVRVECITDSTDEVAYGNWVIVPHSAKSFTLKNGAGEGTIGEFNFGEPVKMPFGQLIFSVTKSFSDSYIDKDFRVLISPPDVVVNNYLASVNVTPVNKNSNAIIISLRDPLPDKAAAIVDNLIKQHNLDAISDKNQVSKNTADFINERIRYITDELSDVEGEAEDFKTRHKLTDVKSEAEIFLKTGSESELSIVETGTQLKLSQYMLDDLSKRTNPGDLLPSNMGLEDVSIGAMINDYNKLVLERNRILKNSSEKNPVVVNIDEQLAGLRKNLKESLANLKAALTIKLKDLDQQEGGINSRIAAVPKYEREYRIIQRQQQIKEALYLYLLQKREETNIALAVTVANAKVIDNAYSDGATVAPKKQIVYLSAFLIGLVIPIIIFYLLNLLDTKVHSKKDIEKLKVPFLGDIPQSSSKDRMIVTTSNNSNIAEGFRLLRTNVEFITVDKKNENKTIFVTSTIGKEGKSFIALNLAASFAISGKKTLLIGTDLRAPKILEYLDLSERKGLTDYVTDASLVLSDIIFNAPGQDNLDILSSGPIPPNPAELLMNPRISELFEQAKSAYPYIIVDTAPVGLVTDTLLISDYADCTVFVARANFLDKRLLRIAETLSKEKRLPNLAILINGSDYTKGYGYGYGYGGYGYGQEHVKRGWKRFF